MISPDATAPTEPDRPTTDPGRRPDWGAVLGVVDHRPWPLSRRPWAVGMVWRDLLFAHWPLPAASVRPLVPPVLELDTFDGAAWVGIVPFRMDGFALRGAVRPPGVAAFLELNVRTYVTYRGRPGVFFFSLDADSPLAVAGARAIFRLPYFRARMAAETGPGGVAFSSTRTDRRIGPGALDARYRAIGPPRLAVPGDLAHFLTERYCLYAVPGHERVLRTDVHHRPWPLRPAEAEFDANGVADAHGIALPPDRPVLHLAERLDVVGWLPERAG